MSEEVAIFAIVQPAPGKLDRLKQACEEAIAWIEENEPETLQFALYEEHTDEGVKIAMFERYASQAALEKHESSENYKKFFKAMTEEQLLAGAPAITRAKHCKAFNR